jgi:ATP-dependent Clp protease ATP-binding subunit ClpA
LEAVKDPANGFRPEFLNRIDAVVVFHQLGRDHILEIVDLMLKEVQARVLDHGLVLQVTDRAREWLAEKGFDPKMGARPLRRLIQNEVEDRLSEELLSDHFKAGDIVEVDVDAEGKVQVYVPKAAPSEPKKPAGVAE